MRSGAQSNLMAMVIVCRRIRIDILRFDQYTLRAEYDYVSMAVAAHLAVAEEVEEIVARSCMLSMALHLYSRCIGGPPLYLPLPDPFSAQQVFGSWMMLLR